MSFVGRKEGRKSLDIIIVTPVIIIVLKTWMWHCTAIHGMGWVTGWG